jgi:hypothetical protein
MHWSISRHMMLERGAHSNWAEEARRLENGTNHSCLLCWKTSVWECTRRPDDHAHSRLARASEARCILGSRDPVERFVWDGVLSEKEAQLGSMFLHVAHGMQEEC